MRLVATLTTLMLLAGCAGGTTARGGTLAKTQYLSAVQSMPVPLRNGSTGAPVVGIVVSGTITNGGNTVLQCSRSEFLLTRPGDGDVAPTAEFCAVPSIQPQQSAYFNATFAAPPRDDWKLRFEHGDGTYEVHDLIVPPAG